MIRVDAGSSLKVFQVSDSMILADGREPLAESRIQFFR
jgi:hypothetical protein